MPDARLERTRATLPAGYQFGDASRGPGSVVRVYDPFRRCLVDFHLPIDERPKAVDKESGIAIRFVKQFNIEVDKQPVRLFEPVHVHDFSMYDHALRASVCPCGWRRYENGSAGRDS